MGMLKLKKFRKKGKKQSTDDYVTAVENPVESETKAGAETEETKEQDELQATEVTTKPKLSADEKVAQMFAKKQNQDKENVVAQKLNAEELVAGMRLSSKSRKVEEKKVGKATEQKKIVEAMLQKQHDPKGFIDSKKGATKVEIPIASDTADSFAERKKQAEIMSKGMANEKKITVDVSHENFGNKSSFAQRREMLESKSQGQKMPSPTNAPQSKQ